MDRLEPHRRTVIDSIDPIGSERIAVARAGDRWLAAPAHAVRAAPPFTCSAMDGYAVRHEDVPGPVELRVSETLYAGDDATASLRPGEAARIFTGAPLPVGADAVVREESTERSGDRVRFRHPARAGENVRPAGEDVPRGGEALPAGIRLGPRALALLAAVGCEAVEVRRRPRVTILSTGDEIVRGRTPDSNGEALAGLLRAVGAEVVRRSAGDEPGALREALRDAAGATDAIVTVGGVSVGERDLVPAALAGLGAETRVHGVPMKPGKPFLFARLGALPVLGLPGSPSACLVAFEVFARPAVLRLSGAERVDRPRAWLPLAEPCAGRPGRARFLWASLEPDGRVRPLGRDAAQVRGPAMAGALVRIGEGAGDVPEGERVETWLLDA